MSESFFKDKIAVVSGAGGTLGSAVAEELARRGAKTALLGRTLEKLERVAARIRETGGTALAVAVDVTDAASVEAARQVINKEWGPCAFLVNAAGGNQTEAVTTITATQADWDACLDLNLRGSWFCAREAHPLLCAAGGGSIVTIASTHGIRSSKNSFPYSAAKGAAGANPLTGR